MTHTVWDAQIILYLDRYSAIPGAKLITTVRSIPNLYESTFGYYFAYVKEYIKAQTLNNFFSNPKDYFHPAEANELSQYARNTMTHDLGYPEESRDLELRLVFEINSCVHNFLRKRCVRFRPERD